MISALSIVGILSIVAFLGGISFGMLIVLTISIHRTSRGPLSKTHCQQRGGFSRQLLTTCRTSSKERGE
jgi:hypothetical protein